MKGEDLEDVDHIVKEKRSLNDLSEKIVCAHFEENYLVREAPLGRKILLELRKRDSGIKEPPETTPDSMSIHILCLGHFFS